MADGLEIWKRKIPWFSYELVDGKPMDRKEIFNEVRQGNFTKVEQWFKDEQTVGVIVNLTNHDGMPLIYEALGNSKNFNDEHLKIAKLIRNHKQFNKTCLAKVLWNLCKYNLNSVHAIKYLLDDNDCDINQDFEDSTPLLLALERVDDVESYRNAAELLCQHDRVQINKSWGPMGPALNRLFAKSKLSGFEMLLRHSECDLNIVSDCGTPLYQAIVQYSKSKYCYI